MLFGVSASSSTDEQRSLDAIMDENPVIALQTYSATNMLMCLISWLPEHSNRHGDLPPSMRSDLTSCPTLNDYCYLIFILRSR